MAFHVPRSGIQAMMKKGTRYMDGKEEVVYDSIATIKGISYIFMVFTPSRVSEAGNSETVLARTKVEIRTGNREILFILDGGLDSAIFSPL